MSDDAKLLADLRALDALDYSDRNRAELWEDIGGPVAGALTRLLDLASEALRSRAVVEAASDFVHSFNGHDCPTPDDCRLCDLLAALDAAAAKGGAS